MPSIQKPQRLEITDITNLCTNHALNAKATGVESKIPITNLANKTTLNTKIKQIENKIPDPKGFICTTEFNRLT